MNPTAEQQLAIHVEMAEKFNFACHQSAHPLLNVLRIDNLSLEQLEDVHITLAADPSFLETKAWRLDRIAPEGSIPVRDRDIKIKGSYLQKLSDAVRGTVTVRAESKGEVLAEVVQPVELLAFNEWGGAAYMPELLAAFCTPNDAVIDRILNDAADVLRRAGKSNAIDGYKSGSRQRVWELASAIYSAIAKLQLNYALPPASFEQNGQKIRMPGQLLKGGVATCLDTTLLFTAALEQAGLNPIVVLPKEHALAGVWLQPSEFASIVIDEAQTLRKHVQLKELLLVETTLLTSTPVLPFTSATEHAATLLAVEHDSTFRAAVDIRQARAHRILPLGLTVEETGLSERDIKIVHEPPFDAGSGGLANFDIPHEDDVPETPEDRLHRWQRKLLDLTARNPLLNHRASQSSLTLLCPDCGKLEDKLAAGARLSIHAIAKEEASGQDEQLHHQRTGENITDAYVSNALDQNRVFVDLPPNELEKRAVNIYRKAQTSLQEGGANTLYLALGFLRWKRDDNADRVFRAPLILLPVTLERQSVRSGVRLKAHDDEPHFNQTLLHLLRTDYDIRIPLLEGDLPTDASGVDVDGIWTAVRRAILDVPGFEVAEDVVLGHFSFAKYLMWKDLAERTDALRKSPLVRHLLDTPNERFAPDTAFVRECDLDKDYRPQDLLTPLPADASQTAAIASADRKTSFVLIGPPGTGKSQTIVNLISHLLGNEKTVLFVSEKTAALDVVHRRLESIGLGRFCLPLHSNKARKADVLKQLGEAWHVSQSMTREEWSEQADKLRRLRDKLNKLVVHLHQTHRNGLTAHYALGIKVRDEDLARRAPLSWPKTDQHDVKELAGLRELVKHLEIQANTVGDVHDKSFNLIAYDDWKPEWERNIAQQARQLASAASRTKKAAERLCGALQIRISDQSLNRLRSFARLAVALKLAHRQQIAFAMEADAADRLETLEAAVAHLRAYAKTQENLSCAYAPMAWRQLDGDDISQRWQAAQQAWWPKSYFACRAIVRELQQKGAEGLPDPANDASVLNRLHQDGEAIDRLGEQLSGLKIWQEHETSPDALYSLHELGQRLRVAVGALADNMQEIEQLKRKIHEVLGNGNELLAPDGAIGRTVHSYTEALAAFDLARQSFEKLGGQTIPDAILESTHALDDIHHMAETIAARQADLANWCDWRKRRNAAHKLGLGPLVAALEQRDITPNELPETFEAAYCAWWSERLLNEDEVLRVSTAEHTAAIIRFRKLDEEFQKATGTYIAAKLSGQLPDASTTKRGSQWGILQRELQKKRRHKPVRQLVQEIPEVLTTLAPCLMMSPLSVAQYLPTDQSLFDVVVFDEASQITVWDAVGSIARGRQAIVVGDPKQMPPTNFFNRTSDDSDGEVDYEGDLESILDEMRASSVPELMLNLHYRSRNESLIAFSNSRYYDNELITFPAAVTRDYAVKLIRPDGSYSRGKAQNNKGEADAIVNEIIRRLTSDEPKVREKSIGVVTFNSKQQTLIEDLLDKARALTPEIEWAFAPDVEEPVFVKNLETVQGDERDVILFSVTYGPDESGHVTMNFGPLNRDGGERRLNVALTRARSEMLVFSTLRSEQIDLSRTRARAVADLKHFLEYAERGPSALGEAVHGSLGDFESPLESAVALALRDRGWTVHSQVGVSAYRIDLGIVHPDAPGAYLAGVECDGAMYHSSATARERDNIRQVVLEGLGWTIFRVWSTDWWKNKADALARVDSALQALLHENRKQKALEAEQEARRQEESQRQEQAKKPEQEAKMGNAQPVTAPSTEAELGEGPMTIAMLGGERGSDAADHQSIANTDLSSLSEHRYRQADLHGNDAFVPYPDRFYDPDYEAKLSVMVDHVVDTEGPIHESVLVQRIARHHGFQRAGRQIKEIVTKLARNRGEHTREGTSLFYWPKGTSKNRLAPSRYLDRDSTMRNPDLICQEELRAIDMACHLNGDPKALADKLPDSVTHAPQCPAIAKPASHVASI